LEYRVGAIPSGAEISIRTACLSGASSSSRRGTLIPSRSNGSFYSLQRPEYYAAWRAETPVGFLFAVKGGRYITHLLRLRGIDTALANFFASGVLALEEKLGPILWQFPASLPFDQRFEQFLSALPHDTVAAAECARGHDARLRGRSWTKVRHPRRLRHALEVRNPSFCCPEFIALLRRHKVALVVADTAGKFPYFEDVTAEFVYVPLHGDVTIYESGYTSAALVRWGQRVRAWRAGKEPVDAVRSAPRAPPTRARDVYVYFDNDAKVHAPYDAQNLAQLLNPRSPAGRMRVDAREKRVGM
jgi:uncharacterized protein YecE (DUF72 family)